MSMNLVTLLYLVSAICFIQALKGLSHPTTSRRGNLFGMLGMGLAVLTTIGLVFKLAALSTDGASAGIGYIIVGLLVGGTAGSIMAKRFEMTKMPELVAFMHSMIGLAAVFIAIAAVVEPQSLGIVQHLGDSIPTGNRLELFLGAAIVGRSTLRRSSAVPSMGRTWYLPASAHHRPMSSISLSRCSTARFLVSE